MKKYIKPSMHVKEIVEENALMDASTNFGAKQVTTVIYDDDAHSLGSSDDIGSKSNVWDTEEDEEQ